ncbi:MAG: hypothetical protein D3924_20600 [Candidatus Electrothrix sp. AR4]|nr:hypothetical protein [Candidatus Electrothrix sp. AR4]
MLAAIYYHCGKEVAARLDVTPYSALAYDERPEELFNGPLTGGKISGLRRTARRRPPSQARVFSLLKGIPGVERVDSFGLSEDRGELRNILLDDDIPCYQLSIPEGREQMGVELTKNGRKAAFSWTRFRTRLEELAFKERALREHCAEIKGLYPPPQGGYRNPGHYSSIQNLFPDIYGINAHGVPEQYPAEEKASASQLKAYLLPFEQLMADYLLLEMKIP